MPRPDGTLYAFEKARINVAKKLYNEAVDATKMHPNSSRIYEASEKKAFANLLAVTTKYAGCKY